MTVSPEEETAKLNECAELGWELITVVVKRYKGEDYTFFYLRKEHSDINNTKNPRFDIMSFSH
jgi:hypothetical protein